MHAAQRGQAHVAHRLGFLDREVQGGGTDLVVAGLALRPAEARGLIRLRLEEAETLRGFRRAPDVHHGIVEAALEPGQFAEHRLASNVQPRVVDRSEPALDLLARLDAARSVTRRDRRPGREQPARRLIPRPVQPAVERVAPIGQLQRPMEVAVMRLDVREVGAAARLEVDVVDRIGELGGRGDVLASELQAIGGRFDPAREQEGVGAAPGGGRPAGRIERREDPLRGPAVSEDDPCPPEPVDDVDGAQRIVFGAPGQRGVDVGSLGAREREVLSLATAPHPLRGGAGGVREPRGMGVESSLGNPSVGHRFERERTDAVEEPVPNGCRSLVVDDHQRTTGEPADDIDRGGRRNVERLEDELDRGERRTAGERGERPEASLVVGEQEVVAPSDRRPERTATLRLPAGRIAEHAESVVQTTQDLLDRQRLGAGRGQLDREGQTVERPAELEDRVVGLAHPVRPSVRTRATREQIGGIRDRQRCELEHGFAVDVERDLTGTEDPQLPSGVEQPDGE